MGRKRAGPKGRSGFLSRWFRRIRRLAVLGGVGGAAYAWWQGRSGGSRSGKGGGSGDGGGGGSGRRAPIGGPRSPSPLQATATQEAEREPVSAVAGLTDTPPESGDTASSSVENNGGSPLATVHPLASVAAPEEAAGEAGGVGVADATWVRPLEGGGCPASHPVKANDNSGIFHVPSGRFYERTEAERCYVSADAAAADGYRPAKA